MSNYLIDFEWVRSDVRQDAQDAFELVFDTPVSIRPNIPEGGTFVSVAPQLAGLVRGAGWIRCTGRRSLCSYRPDFPNLHRIFAQIRKPQELLQFVNRFGPLTNAGKNPAQGERVDASLAHAAQIARLLRAYQTEQSDVISGMLGVNGISFDAGGDVAEVEVRLVFDPTTRRPRLQVRPRNLLNYLWLVLAQSLSGQTTFRQCELCGEGFEVGAGTGRRADAIFCSTSCQRTYNSRKRTLTGS